MGRFTGSEDCVRLDARLYLGERLHESATAGRRTSGELRAETSEVVPPYEIASLFQYGVDRAATKTAAHAREELGGHKHVWPAPDHPYECAKRVVAETKHAGRPLRYWNGTWFTWCGTHYRSTSVEGLRDRLYKLLAEAEYIGAKGDPLRWKPTPKKLNDVIDATRGLVAVPAGVGASCWIDGHTEPVIACANGLVRVADRELLPHTPEFFNTFALEFNFEPDAPVPKRWLDFLSEVFPDDPGVSSDTKGVVWLHPLRQN